MTEIHAALGLASLKYLDSVLHNRREKYELYMKLLGCCDFLRFQKFPTEAYNYSYMPVVLKDENLLLEIAGVLNKHGVYPRRYFYPSLSNVDVIACTDNVPVAEDLASKILCLPLYDKLPSKQIERICGIVVAQG